MKTRKAIILAVADLANGHGVNYRQIAGHIGHKSHGSIYNEVQNLIFDGILQAENELKTNTIRLADDIAVVRRQGQAVWVGKVEPK